MLRGGTYRLRNAVTHAIFWRAILKGALAKRWVPFLRVTTLRGRRGRPSARLGEDGGEIFDFATLRFPVYPPADFKTWVVGLGSYSCRQPSTLPPLWCL